MLLTEIAKAITSLTPDDFNSLSSFIAEERTRRSAERQVAEAIVDLQEAGAIQSPAAATEQEIAETGAAPEWVNPGTDHAKMYTQSTMYVSHNGRIWRNNHTGLNSWEPGSPGVYASVWEDVTDQFSKPPTRPGEPAPVPEFKQPTGSHDAYNQGDRVTYKGQVWESTISGNVWAPDAYPQGWKQVL